jgi:hypothetical protein
MANFSKKITQRLICKKLTKHNKCKTLCNMVPSISWFELCQPNEMFIGYNPPTLKCDQWRSKQCRRNKLSCSLSFII